MAHVPIPRSVPSSYLTETAAVSQINNLRQLYAGRGLNERQLDQLDAVVKDGVRKVEDIYWKHQSSNPNARQQEADVLIARVEGIITKAVSMHDQQQAQINAANAGTSASASAPPPAEENAQDAQRRRDLIQEYDRINRNMAIRQHPNNPAAAHQLIADAEQHKPKLAALPLPKLAHFVDFVEEEARKHTQTLAQNPNLTLHSLGHGGRNSHFSYLTSRQAARYGGY